MSAIAASKIVAIDAGIQAGAITYWRLTDGTDCNAFIARLRDAGLDRLLPRELSEERLLKRALTAVQDRRLLVRPLGQRGHWALVAETPTADGGLAHREILRAWVSPQGALMLDDMTGEGTDTLRATIKREYEAARATFSRADLSGWLVTQVMRALGAVSLRDTGGVYFVPRDATATLDTIAEVLGADQTIFRIPAMHSADAADAVLAAIEAEATAAIGEIEQWLTDNTEPGEKARRARDGVLAEVRGKLTRYEDLFGRRLSTVGQRLGAVRNQLAGIRVVVDAVADGRQLPQSGERGLIDLNDY